MWINDVLTRGTRVRTIKKNEGYKKGMGKTSTRLITKKPYLIMGKKRQAWDAQLKTTTVFKQGKSVTYCILI